MAYAGRHALDLTIIVEGGLVQAVLSNDAMLVGRTVRLIDDDVEGREPDEAIALVKWCSNEAPAFVGEQEIAPVDYEIVDNKILP